MRWIRVTAAIGVIGLLAGCEQPQEGATDEARETAAAAQEFDPAAYDTVTWASDSAAIARGADIFKWVCAECHGERGLGDGGRVIDGDTIRPPSFHQEDWAFADDPSALHRKVFVGNTLGMPHWGLRQMRPRDIVAVERYIRLELAED
jgi:mono/diheme cytochrome c family protein